MERSPRKRSEYQHFLPDRRARGRSDRATVTIRTSAFGGPDTVTLMGKGAGGFPFPGTRESTKPEST